MAMNKLTTTTLALCLHLAGCASRSGLEADNPIKPAADLYNRNFIAAAPTLAGNLLCGAPFLLLSTGIAGLYTGKRSDSYYRAVNNVHVVPATLCGALTGALFVPLSFVCPQDPWDFDFKTVRNMPWQCKSPASPASLTTSAPSAAWPSEHSPSTPTP
jgi:hypothetical protein